MKERIQEILEREIGKIHYLSTSDLLPLGPNTIKSLDTLIKAYRAFVDPAPNPPAKPTDDPASSATEDLLSAVMNGQEQG